MSYINALCEIIQGTFRKLADHIYIVQLDRYICIFCLYDLDTPYPQFAPYVIFW